ncbi:MAG TPA: bifunctional hydroxymethylpyrimidine kinase/phosphomethylpyrimidine kinase, partial [Thermoanaerobaculia bacterium]|nr:bifunctional hydroxymethylpyrimidine kinase/phosphomethylpyrimidine kinase [Thermoanaerobaculia bacterium]
EREVAARSLAASGPAVLLKGGHGEGPEVVDLLVDLSAEDPVRRFRRPRLATRATHGTGCTLSAAIAVRLARGEPLPGAVAGAIDYLHGAMAAAYPLGSGHGPVDHLYALFPERP